MAIDWIKMRVDLQTHPKVVRILSATGTDKFRVIGGLHAVWGVFDAHSVDGVLKGYSLEAMDHIIGWEGFSKALLDVGWLAVNNDDSLVLPEFSEHNGKSGKRRAEDQKRKRDARNSTENDQKTADRMRTKCGLDKKRKEYNKHNVDHYAFAQLMAEKINIVLPRSKSPNLDSWANDIRLLNEIDNIPMDEISRVFMWANQDSFWQTNIQSPKSLGRNTQPSTVGRWEKLNKVANLIWSRLHDDIQRTGF